MKTAVMTDTNSGIMKAEADSMGIFLIPMPVIINDETHYEGNRSYRNFFLRKPDRRKECIYIPAIAR